MRSVDPTICTISKGSQITSGTVPLSSVRFQEIGSFGLCFAVTGSLCLAVEKWRRSDYGSVGLFPLSSTDSSIPYPGFPTPSGSRSSTCCEWWRRSTRSMWRTNRSCEEMIEGLAVFVERSAFACNKQSHDFRFACFDRLLLAGGKSPTPTIPLFVITACTRFKLWFPQNGQNARDRSLHTLPLRRPLLSHLKQTEHFRVHTRSFVIG